jgi:hypothetical protein
VQRGCRKLKSLLNVNNKRSVAGFPAALFCYSFVYCGIFAEYKK